MTNAPTILLVHHGDTELDEAGCINGWSTEPLTESGMEQIRNTGRALAAKVDVTFVVAGSLVRTRQTGDIIANECFCPVQYAYEARPWDEGDWAGKKASEVFDEMRWYSRHPGQTAPGGEPFATYIARWSEWLQALWTRVKRHPEVVPVVVTHAMNINSARVFMTGRKGDLLGAEQIPPGSVHALTLRGKKVVLEPIQIATSE